MHANPSVTSVEARSHLPVFWSIPFHIGVEQKQIATPHFHAPYFGIDRTMPGIHLYLYRPAIFSDRRFHCQLIDIGLEILFPLPTVAVETLAEISLSIKQTHTNQRNSQIGGALDVIAREHSQSA